MYGHPTVFSAKEETSIVRYLCTVTDWGFPMSMLDARMIGKLYLDQAGCKVKSFKNNTPGINWAHGYLRHHKSSLTSHLCQNIYVVCSKVDSETVNKFFDNIAVTFKDVEASNIVNYDETNLSDDPGAESFCSSMGHAILKEF